MRNCTTRLPPIKGGRRSSDWRLRHFAVCALALTALAVSSIPADAQPQCPALVLNGPTSYAMASHTVYPDSSALVNFTLEAWIFPTASSASMIIMTDDAYDLSFVNSGGSLGVRMVFYNQTNSTVSQTRFGGVPLNQWTHVAVTYNAATKQSVMYLNGAGGSPLAVSHTSFGVFGNNFGVGAFGSSSSFFRGFIDDVRISKSVRYTSNFSPPASITADGNTRAIYTFSEAPSATSFADSSGNGHTLSAGGGAQAGNSPTATCGPVISPQPGSQTIVPGDAALLSVGTLGPVASTFQWYGGASGDTSNPIAGATSVTYLTPALASTTQYWVNVSNVNGSIASSTATITVLAAGAAFAVNSTADAVDASPGDGTCAAAGGACTLRAAIQESNALSATSHVITLPAGTFTMTISGRDESAGATGDFNVRSFVRIVGAGAALTIIDGAGLDRVFQTTPTSGLSLADLTIQNGNPGSALGGGILSGGGASLTLTRVTVKSNTTSLSGGGVAAITSKAVLVTDATITQNSSGSGGGLYLNSVTAMIRRTAVAGNTATSSGGGVYAFASILNMAGDAVTANTSTFSGGGVYLTSSSAPQVVSIANTTISGNSTTFSGGALYVTGGNIVALINNTMASNASGFDGAVTVFGQTQVRNTIISGNTGTASANCSVQGTGVLTNLGNNLEFPGTVCGFSLPSDRRADPLLGSLGSNGGPTQTRAIPTGSPAFDAGADAACSAGPVSGVDQRGSIRPKGAHCDMGAYEASLPFTDDPIVAGSTLIKGVHISELRSRIDSIRASRQLPQFTWTDSPVVAGLMTRAVHIVELREALRQAYVAAGVPPPGYTDSGLSAGTPIKAVHLNELRAAVQGIE
jgi:CSLREA domain-containing protein